MRFSTLVLIILTSSCLGEQRQDAIDDVDSNDLLSTKFGKRLIFMWRFIETNAAAMGTLNDCSAVL
jgi:hypothetical protein